MGLPRAQILVPLDFLEALPGQEMQNGLSDGDGLMGE